MLIVVPVAIIKCYNDCSGRPDSTVLKRVEESDLEISVGNAAASCGS